MTQPRGFTLLIAIILSSVILAVGLALLDITFKQAVLASAAKQSQIAFYAADSALECALYWDQKHNFFTADPTQRDANLTQADVLCGGLPVTFDGAPRRGTDQITDFNIPCAGGTGIQASVRVYKNFPQGQKNRIYTEGYNSCNDSDPRRIERGLKAQY